MLIELIKLARPVEWSKSLFNMLIAAAIAYYYLGALIDLPVFVLGFFSVSLLWGGLYALNDYTDREADAKHAVKSKRPIPSGKVPARLALVFSLLLMVCSFAIALQLSFLLVVCLTAMLANQFLYTLKPFQFKKKPVLDLVSGSMINPVFRFYSGWVLFIPAFNAPVIALLFVVGLQLGGYGLYRLASKSHDEEMDYSSSVTVFGERNMRIAFYAAIAIGALSFLALLLTRIIPLRFLALAILSIPFIPGYWNSMKEPEAMDMKKVYKKIYLHTILFIAGFIVLTLI